MIVRDPFWRGTAIQPSYRPGLGATVALDCDGNPAAAGTITQVDPTTGACVSIPSVVDSVSGALSDVGSAASALNKSWLDSLASFTGGTSTVTGLTLTSSTTAVWLGMGVLAVLLLLGMNKR